MKVGFPLKKNVGCGVYYSQQDVVSQCVCHCHFQLSIIFAVRLKTYSKGSILTHQLIKTVVKRSIAYSPGYCVEKSFLCQNKLECLSLSDNSSQVLCLRIRLGVPSLPTNNILNWKGVSNTPAFHSKAAVTTFLLAIP